MPDEKEQEQRIRGLTYFLWLDEDKPEGRDKEHWERARAALEEADRVSAEYERSRGMPRSGS